MLKFKKKRGLHLKNGWNRISIILKILLELLKNFAFTTQLIKRFLCVVQEGRQEPLIGSGVWYYSQVTSFFPAPSEAGLSLFPASPFDAGKSLVSWVVISTRFPCVPFSPCVCTFLSEDSPFPVAFFGFVSSLSGAGLVDSLPGLFLGSSFPVPNEELTFLWGTCWERGEDSGSWSAWPWLLLPLLEKLGPLKGPFLGFLFVCLFYSLFFLLFWLSDFYYPCHADHQSVFLPSLTSCLFPLVYFWF